MDSHTRRVVPVLVIAGIGVVVGVIVQPLLAGLGVTAVSLLVGAVALQRLVRVLNRALSWAIAQQAHDSAELRRVENELAVVRVRERELGRLNADLDAVSRATAQVLAGANARQAVVDAAAEVTGAISASLLEPVRTAGGVTALRIAAVAGVGTAGMEMPLDQPGRAVRAYTTGQLQFVTDVADDESVNAEAMQALERAAGMPIRSMLAMPVVRDGQVRAVLSMGMPAPLATADLRLIGLLELLAADASLAISREDTARELARLATTDALTGVANRRTWDDKLAEAAERSDRTGSPFTVVVLDLDHFKVINDSLGHQAGDEMLITVTRRWSPNLRSGDVLARLGGEEFGVLLSDCNAENASRTVERLLAVMPDGATCSAGVAEYAGSESPERTLGRADQALYAAKRNGRNQLKLAPPIVDRSERALRAVN